MVFSKCILNILHTSTSPARQHAMFPRRKPRKPRRPKKRKSPQRRCLPLQRPPPPCGRDSRSLGRHRGDTGFGQSASLNAKSFDSSLRFLEREVQGIRKQVAARTNVPAAPLRQNPLRQPALRQASFPAFVLHHLVAFQLPIPAQKQRGSHMCFGHSVLLV